MSSWSSSPFKMSNHCSISWSFLSPHGIVGRFGGVFEPARHNRLAASVEHHRLSSLDVQVAEEGIVPAGEGEPRHRGGDADVDADHAGVEVLLELARGVAALR